RLVDEVIYARRRTNEPRNKIERLTARLLHRFALKHMHRLGSELPGHEVDFVTMGEECNAETVQAQLLEIWPWLHQGSVLMIRNIYFDAAMKRLWQMIQAKPEVTVTIDLFHVGLVFF